MAVLIGLSVVMIGLAVWVSHQVLGPTEALENSRGELQRMYQAAKADSMRDGLTGLGNFRAFQEELDRQIEWYQRYKVPLALLIVDVDDLNVLNQNEGHAAGDEVLREMGQLVGQIARYADRSFRIGGDKFAVLMPHTDVEGALQMGRRLLATAAQPKANGHSVYLLGRRVGLSRPWPPRVSNCSHRQAPRWPGASATAAARSTRSIPSAIATPTSRRPASCPPRSCASPPRRPAARRLPANRRPVVGRGHRLRGPDPAGA